MLVTSDQLLLAGANLLQLLLLVWLQREQQRVKRELKAVNGEVGRKLDKIDGKLL